MQILIIMPYCNYLLPFSSLVLLLERYFGSEAQGWLNLQNAYDLRAAELAHRAEFASYYPIER